jgi:hypothetical protein
MTFIIPRHLVDLKKGILVPVIEDHGVKGGFIETNTSPIAEIDGNLAWDSVSAAAAYFQCDRKAIRYKLGKKFKRISLDE